MERPKTTLERPSRAPLIAIVVAVVAAAFAAGWWFRTRTTGGPAVAPVAAPAGADAGTEAAAEPDGGVVEPATARSLVEAISPSALFRRWAGEGDLVRRWVVVTDNLAEGVSPRGQLAALAPARPFAVLEKGGETVIAPASYHRSDDVGDVVASIDAAAAARCYRALRPTLQAAYRALGYPGANLDAVTARALRRLLAAPVREGDVAVRKAEGGGWAYADERLEALGPIDKHLLRMGPRNARLVQDKARELLTALGMDPAGPPGR